MSVTGLDFVHTELSYHAQCYWSQFHILLRGFLHTLQITHAATQIFSGAICVQMLSRESRQCVDGELWMLLSSSDVESRTLLSVQMLTDHGRSLQFRC